MTYSEAHQLFWDKPLFTHSFNKDRSYLAVSPNSNEVHIFKKSGTNWEFVYNLAEHDKLVTGIDWAPNSNRIVTCSQDRNAYVWSFDGQSWKPELVMLRINRAATCVKWSPNETKFAVGTGAKVICICSFSEADNWWGSKHLKKPLKSTILCLDWHPDNILLAAGSTDKKVRVFSAFIKGLDEPTKNAVWGEKLPFEKLCGEFGTESTGWIHSVAFSPSGNQIAFTGHDSTFTVVSPGQSVNSTVKGSMLPLTSVMFVSENQAIGKLDRPFRKLIFIGVGHDCRPYLFSFTGSQWQLTHNLDEGKKKSFGGNSAMDKFRQMDSRNQQAGTDTELSTVHQNTITCVRAFAGNPSQVTKISTSGIDGRIVLWDLLAAGVSGMSLR
ncbi:Polycomb protein sop-2 [Clydaea vesicula]|uniref:Actin-related protein 2/3 complex subunit n=1 Tax=Clydaea vesicula TaxID=447962 RepID=A0AAD5U357_9FUNG|nr:Polycomb protein sop-2 [Clydaea vesicula]